MSEPKLSEKDVAEIRKRALGTHITTGGWSGPDEKLRDTNKCPCVNCADRRSLLADRDAHLADLADNTSLFMATRSIAVHMRDSQQGEPSGLNIIIRNIDAFLERTK